MWLLGPQQRALDRDQDDARDVEASELPGSPRTGRPHSDDVAHRAVIDVCAAPKNFDIPRRPRPQPLEHVPVVGAGKVSRVLRHLREEGRAGETGGRGARRPESSTTVVADRPEDALGDLSRPGLIVQ